MTPISFPGKDSDKTEAVDTLGVIAYTNFSGRWVGTFEEIQDATQKTSLSVIMESSM